MAQQTVEGLTADFWEGIERNFPDLEDLPKSFPWKSLGELETALEDETADMMQCVACEEIFVYESNQDHYWDSYGEDREVDSTEDGDLICRGCLESDEERCSTVMIFSPDEEKQVVKMGVYFQRNQETYERDSLVERVLEVISGPKWVKTDDWRGYTDHDLLIPDKWVKYTSGWVTGWPDETTSYKTVSSDLFEDLNGGELTPPVEVWWLFAPTSNVFSTASDIILRKDDLDLFNEWLEENGYKVDDVKHSFS